MTNDGSVGFVGVGHMGGAMAARLLGQGVALVVHDRDDAAAARLAELGAIVAASAADVAARCDVVFTCLPTLDACLAVATTLAAGRVAVHVECSTIGRTGIVAVAAAHPAVETVDAPISGGPKGAAAGTLTAIASGAPSAIARVRPLLDRLAARVFVMGDRPGDAQLAKVVNNALSISAMAVSCEAIALGVKGGLDAAKLVEMINVSTGRNSATLDKFPKAILPRTFDYGGPLAIGVKDLQLYLDEAAAEGLPAWSLVNVAQLWRVAVDRLGPDGDLSTLIRLFEDWAGVTVGREEGR